MGPSLFTESWHVHPPSQPLPWLISSWCSLDHGPWFQIPSIQFNNKNLQQTLWHFFSTCANYPQRSPKKKKLFSFGTSLNLYFICCIYSTYTYIYIIHIYINTLQSSCHSNFKKQQTSATKKDLKRRCNILTRSLASRFRRLQLVIDQHDF